MNKPRCTAMLHTVCQLSLVSSSPPPPYPPPPTPLPHLSIVCVFLWNWTRNQQTWNVTLHTLPEWYNRV